jgi:hypothetical protein
VPDGLKASDPLHGVGELGSESLSENSFILNRSAVHLLGPLPQCFEVVNANNQNWWSQVVTTLEVALAII